MTMNKKSINDFEASLAVIKTNTQAYYAGNLHAYRPVAVELRKLLCDTQGKSDNSLVKRCFSNIWLRPLSGDQKQIDEYTALYIPGQVLFDGQGGSRFTTLFNESGPSLPLNEWLQQKLFDASTTIRNFIRSVADKEGAHSDKSYNAILGKTKSVFLSDDTLAAKTIVAVGRYIIKALALQMVNDNIIEIAAHIINEHNKVGRGAALMNLSEFAARFSQGVPLKYEPASVIEDHFKRDPSNLGPIRQALQTYEPSEFFLILVIDLNSERCVYQQSMKTDKT